jgi:hypothetical protein
MRYGARLQNPLLLKPRIGDQSTKVQYNKSKTRSKRFLSKRAKNSNAKPMENDGLIIRKIIELDGSIKYIPKIE